LSRILPQVNFIVFLVYLSAVIYLFAYKTPTPERNLCVSIVLCFALWSFCEAHAHLSPTPERALMWFSISSFGWIIFPLPVLFFYLAVTRGIKPNFKALLVLSFLCFFLITAQWRGDLINEVARGPFGWVAFWANSPAFHLFVIYYSTILFFCAFLALKFWLNAEERRQRAQGKILFFTVVAGFFVGTFSDVVAPMFEIFQVPPVACLAGLIWLAGMVPAVTKYGLLSLELGYFKDLYERLFEFTPDPLALLDERGIFLSANQAMINSLGQKKDELIGKSLRQVLDAKTYEFRMTVIEEALRSGQVKTFEDTRKGRHFRHNIVPVSFQDSKNTVLVISRDITEEVKAMRQLEFYAYHDYLTGLPNRAMLEIKFSEMTANCDGNSLIAVFFLDLDEFKFYNDSLGHDVGDEILKEFGKRLCQKVRNGLVGRFGGDEFIVILPHIKNTEHVEHAASEIVSTLKTPTKIRGFDVSLSPSIGISLYPKDGTSFDELIRHADIAMYKAKKSARSYCFFQEDRAFLR
jgi:diguanylate cyclase (GGDEF)-like protein/PAS domain S-box-containing protein